MLTAHRNLSVLTIDDDNDMRRSIVSYLEDMGFNVHQASGGREGIDLFEKCRPDLVFTDLMMPGVDGLSVVNEIMNKSPDTPVVVISGIGSVEYAIKAVRNGAWDYITKPILDFTVIDTIANQVLDRAYSIKSERAYKESLQKAVLSQDRQLAEIGSSDPLTRLPTRNQIREKFSQMIINTNFTGELFVILIEVENYKSVNETFGHESGDQMIIDLADRLKMLAMPDVAVGRLGTDEFVIMTANSQKVDLYISAVTDIFNEPLKIMELEVYAGFNMGISSFPQDGESIDSLLQHADIARSNAKLTGKNRHCFYSRELWEHVQDRIAMESALRKGLERKEFLLHYQPKVDARSKCIVGMETLIRWKPTGKDCLVSPVVFVPALEMFGLISEVGAWVLETACAQHVDWRKQGMGPVRLSVNISAIQFLEGNLPEVVKGVIDRTGMEPDMLCLELTESIVVKDIHETIETLNKLAQLGIKLSIDDFGTGYSSLSYIKDMPINELKIDRSFVMNLPGDPASVAIVESVLAMSKGMNMTVVAEGVETHEQADFLAGRGCHELQGYLFSKPLAKEDFFSWCIGVTLPH